MKRQTSPLNWRALSPNTMRSYQQAATSFEKTIGKPAADATVADIETWLGALRAAGRSTSTCRTYISAINTLSGLAITPSAVSLTSGKRATRPLLTLEQIRVLLQAMKIGDRALMAALLLYGSEARSWTWGYIQEHGLEMQIGFAQLLMEYVKARGLHLSMLPHHDHAHWLGEPCPTGAAFSVNGSSPFTTQEITRRLQRYARLVGLDARSVSMRTLVRSGRALMASAEHGGDVNLAEVVCPMVRVPADQPGREALAVSWVSRNQDPRLHGIGRRTR